MNSDAKEIRKRAKELERFLRKALAKQRDKLKEADAQSLEKGLQDLQETKDPERLKSILDSLEQRAEKTLGFAKKTPLREYTESLVVAGLIALALRAFVVEPFKIPSGSMFPTLKVGDHLFVSKFLYGLRVPDIPGSEYNLWFLRWSQPSRGDVIVFRNPTNLAEDYIKRVVAVEGDEVEVDGSEVFVNGRPLPRDSIPELALDQEGDESSRGLAFEAFMEGPFESENRYEVIYEKGKRVGGFEGLELNGFDCALAGSGRRRCRVKPDHVMVMGDHRTNSRDSRVWGGVPIENIKGKALFIWWSYGSRQGIRWARFGKGVP
ncbi:MAG: signal peptidase I [Myxococcota bacterium]